MFPGPIRRGNGATAKHKSVQNATNHTKCSQPNPTVTVIELLNNKSCSIHAPYYTCTPGNNYCWAIKVPLILATKGYGGEILDR